MQSEQPDYWTAHRNGFIIDGGFGWRGGEQRTDGRAAGVGWLMLTATMAAAQYFRIRRVAERVP